MAQDVEASTKKRGFNFSGIDAPKDSNDIYGLSYAEFEVPLVKAVQELSKQNDELISAKNIQDKKIDELQKQIDELKALKKTSAPDSFEWIVIKKSNYKYRWLLAGRQQQQDKLHSRF